MKKAAVKNPVMVLDEVDKMGVDMLGRSGGGAARGARSGAERHLPGSLPRRPLRPLAGDLSLHRQQPRHHPPRPLGSHGGHRVRGLHARREAQHRPGVSVPQAAERPRHDRRAPGLSHRGAGEDHRQLHARGRRPQPGARDWRGLPLAGHARRRGGDGSGPRGRRRGGGEDPGPPALHARSGRAHQLAGGGHRPGLDAQRGGHPLHRGHVHARQGRGHGHRQPEERHERERGDGGLVRAQPGQGSRAWRRTS